MKEIMDSNVDEFQHSARYCNLFRAVSYSLAAGMIDENFIWRMLD